MPRRRPAPGGNRQRVTWDQSTLTWRPLAAEEGFLLSNDSESDPLKVNGLRVSSFLVSNKECGFSTHPAPSLMTWLIAAVPSCSPYYDSVITGYTCFSFPLSLLYLSPSVFLKDLYSSSLRALPLFALPGATTRSASMQQWSCSWRKCLLTFLCRLQLFRGGSLLFMVQACVIG